jgi:ankyrin repeat protein
MKVIKLLLSKGALINQAAKDGTSALSAAAQEGNANVVALLISSGASIDQADNDGDTPLYFAALQHGPVYVSARCQHASCAAIWLFDTLLVQLYATHLSCTRKTC